MSVEQRTKLALTRPDILVPLALLVLFLLVSIPGVAWGTPDIWNPDELVGRVDLALGGELEFDETEPDFNYPSLPKYVMYGLGRIVYGLGLGRTEFIVSARVLSAILGGLAVVMAFFLVRMLGGRVATAGLAGLLTTASSVVPSNARFAHNDMYLQLFVMLCVLSIVKYQRTQNRAWLYASFLFVGLSASSKYTGGSLILLPLAVVVGLNWRELRGDWLGSAERLFLGLLLAFLGYAAGTPKALLWMSFYFKRVVPALLRYPQYGLQPNSTIGLFGQWAEFRSAVGPFLYYLFLLSAGWFSVRLILAGLRKLQIQEARRHSILILLMALVIFDLPFMISVNYIPRYFIPFVPLLSVLAALFVEETTSALRAKSSGVAASAALGILTIGLAYSFLRGVSTTLLFVNDARGPAGEYLKSLRSGTVLEYTLYPPIIPEGHFAKARNYPIFLLKYPGDAVPTDKPYDYNVGEAGLLERGVDYLVVDSITYSRFGDEYICQSNPVECDFFSTLLSGETQYTLLEQFEYSLPGYMPRVRLAAVNPAVGIYERQP
jgi:hypothetical protein